MQAPLIESERTFQEMEVDEVALSPSINTDADDSLSPSSLQAHQQRRLPGGLFLCLESAAAFGCITIPLMLFIGLRLFVFVVLLLPGFVRFFWFYVTCQRRVERYSSVSCRNTCDVYGFDVSVDSVDARSTVGKPVLVFFPGGAWLIGYKMWGSLTAKALVPFGILVIICDYRNYPWGTVPDAVDDVTNAIRWVLDHCAVYGGDSKRVIVLGQSAGGHLGCCSILQRAISDETDCAGFHPRDLAGFVSLSAPFDLSMMRKTFSNHGMAQDFVDRIFGNRCTDFDPQCILSDATTELRSNNLPPIAIFHGSCDKTVPPGGSRLLCASLKERHGVSNVSYTEYDGWSHTDAILERIMDADHRFHRDLFRLIQRWTDHDEVFDESHPSCQKLCPSCLVSAGRVAMPF